MGYYSRWFRDRYFTVPQIKKETLCKELQRLLYIKVLNPVHKSQYGTPKKEGTGRFIVDYQEIDPKIIRNPYPLARIGESMKKM